MTDLFLSPHNDDETLFGAFTIQRYRPVVVVCYYSAAQQERGYGITAEMRVKETGAALKHLGVIESWIQANVPDTNHDVDLQVDRFRELKEQFAPERVWAPSYYPTGHGGHNAVGLAAQRVFSDVNLTFYATYTPEGKVTTEHRVDAPTWMIGPKLKALAEYKSQWGHYTCAEHFLRDQNEYYA